MDLPPLNALRAFEATARLLSFSRAGDKLHVTHTAVSHQIKLLEAWIGCKLFHREGKGIRLTGEGHELSLRASAALEDLADICQRIRLPRRLPILTVGCLPSIASRWLVPRLPAFYRAYPEIDLRLFYAHLGEKSDQASCDVLIKDPDTGRRVSRLNPAAEWVIQDVCELRIVDQDLWERAKARQEAMAIGPQERGANPLVARRRPKYLLAGLLKCGCCGSAYTLISKRLLGCAAARNKGTCGNRLNIRVEALEASVVSGLRTHLMDQMLFEEFCEEFTREVNRLPEVHRAHRSLDATDRPITATQLVPASRSLGAIEEPIPAPTFSARTMCPSLLIRLINLLWDSSESEPNSDTPQGRNSTDP
jgi:DNA-binding transcriptional LysR family regulator